MKRKRVCNQNLKTLAKKREQKWHDNVVSTGFVKYFFVQLNEYETVLQHICYSQWTNGAQNRVISIWQRGVFNHEKSAI